MREKDRIPFVWCFRTHPYLAKRILTRFIPDCLFPSSVLVRFLKKMNSKVWRCTDSVRLNAFVFPFSLVILIFLFISRSHQGKKKKKDKKKHKHKHKHRHDHKHGKEKGKVDSKKDKKDSESTPAADYHDDSVSSLSSSPSPGQPRDLTF